MKAQKYFEGFRPEWYISTIYHAWDAPFWSVTLDFADLIKERVKADKYYSRPSHCFLIIKSYCDREIKCKNKHGKSKHVDMQQKA